MSNARNVVNQIVDDIVKDATKTLESTVKYVAEMTASDWERMARHVMDAYYSDYSETTGRYERTFSMRDNVIERVLRKDGDGYVAGIKFDPSRMNHGDLSQFREYDIWENFMYGQHGNEDYTTPKTKQQITRNVHFTTPYAKAVLDKYYGTYDRKVDKYFEEGLKRAMLGK